jgi:3-hydroxymyristoyl/3-hydroxydecanoyl-(acyl carrier protein) dehydratase
MPIFPGVMIIEAMAQTSGVLVGLSMDLVDKNAKVFFMGVDGVKFRRKVVPGDVLELHVTALRGGGRVWKFEGRAMVDGELACEADLHGHVRRAEGLSAWRSTARPSSILRPSSRKAPRSARTAWSALSP